MEEMLAKLLNGVPYLELIAALCATLYFYKYKTTPLRWLLPYLWLVFLIEILAKVSIARQWLVDNRWIYNIQSIIEYMLIFYIYHRLFIGRFHKKLTRWLLILFPLLALLTFLFVHHSFIELNTTAFSVGSLIVIYLVIAYFQEVLSSDQVLSISKNLTIWVSIGWLFYHAGSIPINLLINDVIKPQDLMSIRPILLVANVILYMSLILGFVWSNKIST